MRLCMPLNWRHCGVQSLVDVGLMEPVNEVIVRSRQVQLLTSPRALSTVPSQPTVLQALYGTRKKLTATQWHVYGVEHMLPQTHVLNHPGMGATLQTYFRRLEGRDARARAAAESLADLTAVAEGPNSWRVGQVTLLGAQDASPFRIGDVDPGATILTIENGSSITVAAPHDPGNNYLLVRRPSGHMLVRKLSGCFLVRPVPYVNLPQCFLGGPLAVVPDCGVRCFQRICNQMLLAPMSGAGSSLEAVSMCFPAVSHLVYGASMGVPQRPTCSWLPIHGYHPYSLRQIRVQCDAPSEQTWPRPMYGITCCRFC